MVLQINLLLLYFDAGSFLEMDMVKERITPLH
jgi:hypothetical protein